MKDEDVMKMLRLRKKGWPLSEIAMVFGVTKQCVYLYLGRTDYLVMKEFKLKCKHCGKKSTYKARKKKVREKKYCSTYCSGMGRRTLGISFPVGSKDYQRVKSAIYFKKHPEWRKKWSKKYYDNNKERYKEYYRKYYLKNRKYLLEYSRKRRKLK